MKGMGLKVHEREIGKNNSDYQKGPSKDKRVLWTMSFIEIKQREFVDEYMIIMNSYIPKKKT